MVNDYVVVGDLVDDEEKKKLAKKFKRYDNTFHIAEKLKNTEKSADKRMEYFKYLIARKPCESMKDYKAEFWGGYDIGCPLAKDGTCFNPTKLKQAIKNKLYGTKVLNQL